MHAPNLRAAGSGRPGALILAFLLAASPLRAAEGYAPDVFVNANVVTDPTPEAFSVCHAGSCAIVSQTRLEPAQWQRIAAVFSEPANGAAEERARIAEAIARFEQAVGVNTDTADDRAENGWGSQWWSQLDCIDESTNTTTYLRILARTGLLRWHRVEARVTRGYFLFGWPHTTAVVSELHSGTRWAVDSWFHDNGRPPEIVPLVLWKTGWRPHRPQAKASP